MITWEFLSEKASRRSKMLNAIFEMKFSFMWLHLFPWESKQSRRLIEWACPWHTPNSKIFISFWHSLKSQSGTKGTLFLLRLFGYTYSSPLLHFSCLSVTTDGDRDIKCNYSSAGADLTQVDLTRTLLAQSTALKLMFCCCCELFTAQLSICKWAFRGACVLTCACGEGSLFGMPCQAIMKAMGTFE